MIRTKKNILETIEFLHNNINEPFVYAFKFITDTSVELIRSTDTINNGFCPNPVNGFTNWMHTKEAMEFLSNN